MTFREYYRLQFRTDIERFLESIPPEAGTTITTNLYSRFSTSG
jgi:hypothetical protein